MQTAIFLSAGDNQQSLFRWREPFRTLLCHLLRILHLCLPVFSGKHLDMIAISPDPTGWWPIHLLKSHWAHIWNPNFMWSLHVYGKWKFVQTIKSHDQDGHHAQIWLKPFKFSSLKSIGQWPWNLVYSIGGLVRYKICSNNDLGVTLTFIMARFNLPPSPLQVLLYGQLLKL